MIKKEKIEKYTGNIVVCILLILLILIGIGLVITTFEQPRISELDLIPFIIGMLLIWLPLIFIIDKLERISYPERFHYCKKCKCILRGKHPFCIYCGNSIKRSLNEIENKKHIKDYKKFYKEKKK